MALLRSLLGIEGTKPFECVGTRQELLAGLFLSIKRRQANAPRFRPCSARRARDAAIGWNIGG